MIADQVMKEIVKVGGWCRNLECVGRQLELDELGKAIRKVERMVLPVVE